MMVRKDMRAHSHLRLPAIFESVEVYEHDPACERFFLEMTANI